MTTLTKILKKHNCKIVNIDNSFAGDEIVVRFQTETAIKYFDKSFPKKNFVDELKSFVGEK